MNLIIHHRIQFILYYYFYVLLLLFPCTFIIIKKKKKNFTSLSLRISSIYWTYDSVYPYSLPLSSLYMVLLLCLNEMKSMFYRNHCSS